MKKILLVVAVVLFTSSAAFSQFKFGMGLTVGTKAGTENGVGKNFGDQKLNYGLNFRGRFDFLNDFGIQGGISCFFPTVFTSGIAQDFTMINAQANLDVIYYIRRVADVKIYALGGLNYSDVLVRRKAMFTSDFLDHNLKPGFELGAGIIMGKLFFEIKYDFSTVDYTYETVEYEIKGSQFI